MKPGDPTMGPLWAFYDEQGDGFLCYQDARGNQVPRGHEALRRWRALGCPHVANYPHARVLGLDCTVDARGLVTR